MSSRRGAPAFDRGRHCEADRSRRRRAAEAHCSRCALRGSQMLTKRLRSEYRSLVKNPDPDIVLQPHEENLRHWVAHIRGPADSPFHEGVFRLRVEAGLQYPMTPPTISFETKIFHPNVHFKVRERGVQRAAPGRDGDSRETARAPRARPARSALTSSRRSGRRRGACRARAGRSSRCSPRRRPKARSTATRETCFARATRPPSIRWRECTRSSARRWRCPSPRRKVEIARGTGGRRLSTPASAKSQLGVGARARAPLPGSRV